ncbi:helix-turn-helix transcriptional regulator [Geodermatophilus sabuli]|uniref:Transcriptional regulator, contains XRE-family HTH domain n=1 Tax=Geodermatophilus sabuli TaxID=1564158 RepID=A0A285EG62_9ACTN|nr:helix-turn-helix transcriptional regulator [Geodermatophilus sabuli]MBB3083113.1 transcriptional regulator with XRE-family HTH domain [Geodermatophilus sabuli]SNX98109.1 Transcriptional regulator, contains XRE-family HTH domain [Geodermatophilus sabuli]
MDTRKDLREFLATRRARITPQQAGLPTYGGHRRVKGLRREELALLAGVSVEYYTRLERGNAHGVSDSVLEALVRALQLDEAERAHLYDLARTADATARSRRRPPQQRVRPGIQRLLDAMTSVPAFVQNGRLDVLAANALARALYTDLFDDAGSGRGTGRAPNHAHYTFLDPRAADFYPDWNRAAADSVSLLRAEVGRSPDDRELTELIGDLTTRSERFSALWATYNVRWHTTGTKLFHHPVVGDLSLAYEGLGLTADPGQTLITFTAEPGSPSQQALTFLASWATSPEQTTAYDWTSEDHTA